MTITNIGDGSGQMLTELGGANPDDFFVVSNGCNELVIAPGQSCTMQIMMIPLAGGHREASLILTAGGVSGDIAMFGEGHFAPLLLATPAAITTDGYDDDRSARASRPTRPSTSTSTRPASC